MSSLLNHCLIPISILLLYENVFPNSQKTPSVSFNKKPPVSSQKPGVKIKIFRFCLLFSCVEFIFLWSVGIKPTFSRKAGKSPAGFQCIILSFLFQVVRGPLSLISQSRMSKHRAENCTLCQWVLINMWGMLAGGRCPFAMMWEQESHLLSGGNSIYDAELQAPECKIYLWSWCLSPITIKSTKKVLKWWSRMAEMTQAPNLRHVGQHQNTFSCWCRRAERPQCHPCQPSVALWVP